MFIEALNGVLLNVDEIRRVVVDESALAEHFGTPFVAIDRSGFRWRISAVERKRLLAGVGL